jgi:hypothetical protein
MKVKDLRNWLRGMEGDAEAVFYNPVRKEYYAIESCKMIDSKAQLSVEAK